MILVKSKERIRFVRFAIVGSIGAVIDFGFFNLLTLFISYFRENAVFAQGISFILAVSSNFTWNRLWTYPDSRSKSVGHQWTQFLIVSMIGLTIRTPLFIWLEEILLRFFSNAWVSSFVSPRFVAHNTSLGIVILIVLTWNYFANRFWTYNDITV